MDIDQMINGIKLGLTIGTSVGLPFTSYALILVDLLDKIHAQGGKTPIELAKEIDATLDMNELRIIANLERLKNVPLPAPTPVPTPTPAIPPPNAADVRTASEIQSRLDRLREQLKTVTDQEIIAGINKKIARQEEALALARQREGI